MAPCIVGIVDIYRYRFSIACGFFQAIFVAIDIFTFFVCSIAGEF